MRVTRKIATGFLLGWMCQSSMAAQPPGIDRPSPPPCCADGQCLASPLTHGYYPTRWRRWPLESAAQAQAQTPKTGPASLPGAMQGDVPVFITPPPEQEDRKAPPPSVPAGEQAPAAVPSGARPTGGPVQPPPGGQGFPTPPAAQPSGTGTQPSTGPAYKNVSPESPLNRSGSGPANSGPMGDADPPPSLPFGPALVSPEQPTRDVSQQPATMPRRSPSVRSPQAPSSDPPPSLPVALASYVE